MRFRKAIVREPGEGFSRCISTHPMRHTVDVARARVQHATYVKTLEDLGLEVLRLEKADGLPDSCFVEDTAVVHGEKALLCRPSEEARRDEVTAIEGVMSEMLDVKRASGPATIEGGDVLHLRDRLVCGLTRRTNREGARQLADWLGVRVDIVAAPVLMHLKSHVSYIRDGTILVTKTLADEPALAGEDRIVVPDGEEYAANVLSVKAPSFCLRAFPGRRRSWSGPA